MRFEDTFEYDESSFSCLVWKGNVAEKVKTRTPAGSKRYRKNGEPKAIELSRKQQNYQVHRIIWELFNGQIEDGMIIDHKDGNPFNNVISNLRMTTQKINCQNRKRKSCNSSGVTGVCWVSHSNKKYTYAKAEVRLNGKNCQQTFSANKLGIMEAFKQAVIWRIEKIQYLNATGEDYTERHGKESHDRTIQNQDH